MKKRITVLMLAFLMIFSSFCVFAEEGTYSNEIWTNASNWALVELNPALDTGLIPEALYTKDFTEDITRLEFAALSVTLYEKLSGKTVITTKNIPFSDTDDGKEHRIVIKIPQNEEGVFGLGWVYEKN